MIEHLRLGDVVASGSGGGRGNGNGGGGGGSASSGSAGGKCDVLILSYVGAATGVQMAEVTIAPVAVQARSIPGL